MSAKRIKLSGSEYRKKAIEKNKKNKDVIEQCQKLDGFFKKTSPLNVEIKNVNTQTIINVDESVDNCIVQSCDKTDSLLENVVENNCLNVLFYEKLKSIYDNQDKKKPWSQEDYDKALNEINDAKLNPGKTKTRNQYYLCRKYDLIEVGNVKHIILKPKTKTENIIYVVPYENYFEKIEESHKATGHGGRDKVEQNLKNKYNIPRIAIQIFINLCTTCNKKKSKPCKGVVIKPILSADFNSRGEIDLIDFQSTPDRNFKWVMIYQDHATKYLYLRPLTSKRATEVAHELLKIFLEQGAPQILQSDNGREFTAKIIEELAEL
ncbi:hypothetical protein QTP88_010710 [Uroleucon formosanum]